MDDFRLELPEHCYHLSRALSELSQVVDANPKRNSGVLLLASDWLNLAAGVCNVEIQTTRFDDSIDYCGGAYRFETARSILLTSLATQISIFNFAWGAFETVAKFADPPRIPVALRPNGANSLVPRSIYYLSKSDSIEGYTHQLDLLRSLLQHFPQFARSLPGEPYPPHMTFAGAGLDFVRNVRNQFAHGSASFPYPDDLGHWCRRASREPHVIGISTRIVLLTIQMMLLRYFDGSQFVMSVLVDEDGLSGEAEVGVTLSKLHTEYRLPLDPIS